ADVEDLEDVSIASFFSDSTQLKVEYLVLGSSTPPFTISVNASSDGVALEDQLALYRVQSPAERSPGLHVVSIPASFDDLTWDYYVMAKIDSAGEVQEQNEANNVARFAAGTFVVDEPTSGRRVLHV